ncbi:MAG TPA: hypothetical protein VFA41_07115 [Ktedonobacteraceae bacterium]|nr:hypothetical protein [Ktedonobacteraceae bacterium]
MLPVYLKRSLLSGLFLFVLLALLAACGGSDNTATNINTNANNNPTGGQPTPQSGTALPSTPGTGPVVVLTPTTTGGNSQGQVIKLADRTLTITSASKVPGSDSSSTGIRIALTVTNTSNAPVKNDASFYQLVGAEGDIFGLPPNVSSSFFGNLAPRASRSGTLLFEVPTAAMNGGLRLLYRPEVASETVFVSLNLG